MNDNLKKASYASIMFPLGVGNGVVDGTFGAFFTPHYLRRTKTDFTDVQGKVECYEKEQKPIDAFIERVYGYTREIVGRGTTLSLHALVIPSIAERVVGGEDLPFVLKTYVLGNVLSAGYEFVRGAVKAVKKLKLRQYSESIDDTISNS